MFQNDELSRNLINAKKDVFRQQIRKENLDQIFQSKRLKYLDQNFCQINQISNQNQEQNSQQECQNIEEVLNKFKEQKQEFQQFEVLQLLKSLRYILCQDPKNIEKKVESIINSEALEAIMKYFHQDIFGYPDVIMECQWCLINITAAANKSRHQIFINLGIIDLCLQSFNHSTQEIQYQSIWILSNLINGDKQIRDFIIAKGVIKKIWAIMDMHQAQIVDQDILLSPFYFFQQCLFSPNIDYFYMKEIFIICCQFIQQDLDISTHILEIFQTISMVLCQKETTAIDFVKELINQNIMPKLILLLDKYPNYPQIILPILKIIGNSFSYNDKFAKYIIDLNLIQILNQNFQHRHKNVRKICAFITSNLFLENPNIISRVFLSNIIQLIILCKIVVNYQVSVLNTIFYKYIRELDIYLKNDQNDFKKIYLKQNNYLNITQITN